MSNIHGLGPVGAKKPDKDKDNEEFSQGGKSSGTSVMRPNGGGGDRNGMNPGSSPIDDILRQAQQRSAEDPTGAGTRNIGTIIVYANGFMLGEDGEFKDAKDPKNKQALEDLGKGVVPQDLEDEVRTKWGQNVQSVGVQMQDKSQETFYPPPPKFSFANSTGTALGSSAPVHVDFSSLEPREYKLCEDDEQTTIQVVTHDRQRLRVKLNLYATVGDLYQHVMFASQLTSDFVLQGGFPPKPLKDYNVSINDAGLKGASVTQRKV